MDKLEKYYNYIVNDLIKNTIVDDSRVYVPFKKGSLLPIDFFLFITEDSRGSLNKHKFINYVTERYGTNGKDVWEIFFRYTEKMMRYYDDK